MKIRTFDLGPDLGPRKTVTSFTPPLRPKIAPENPYLAKHFQRKNLQKNQVKKLRKKIDNNISSESLLIKMYNKKFARC
jgi:hypothetical protein